MKEEKHQVLVRGLGQILLFMFDNNSVRQILLFSFYPPRIMDSEALGEFSK